MKQIATLTGLKCPHCGSEQIKVTGVKGALGASTATSLVFGAVGNFFAGKNAAANTATTPLQYKCAVCGKKFESLPLCAPKEEILDQPCKVTFTRERNFVGAAVPQILYLNGIKLGAVKNGETLTFETYSLHNVLFVTDQHGVAFKSEYRFDAQPGGTVPAHFNRRFLDSTPIPVESPTAAAPQEQISVTESRRQPLAVRFCVNCGAPLESEMRFCRKCGTKRFSPEITYAGASSTTPMLNRAMTVFSLLAGTWILLLLFQRLFLEDCCSVRTHRSFLSPHCWQQAPICCCKQNQNIKYTALRVDSLQPLSQPEHIWLLCSIIICS